MKIPARIVLAIFSCAFAVATPAVGGAATFTDVGAGLTGLYEAATAWGDYDSDGDLDIAVVGNTIGGRIARIYRNTAGAFADASALPPTAAVSLGAIAWGDYDRDGDLDLAIAGDTGTGYVTRIYRNNAGTFTDIAAGLEGFRDCAVKWADFDNDGDLDLSTAGDTGSQMKAHVYRNTPGGFVESGIPIAGVQWGSMAWADYDLDGDNDLVVAGAGPGFNDVTTLYQNTGGILNPVAAGLRAVRDCSLDWGDYDNDGDPDLLIAGAYYTEVWRNTAGSFAYDGSVIQGVTYASAVFGDYDNDSRLDVVEGGATGSTGFGAIYHNNGPGFSDISGGMPNLFDAAFAWGDYDKDGDLDVLAAGTEDLGTLFPIHRIYRCAGVTANAAPSAPTGLSVTTTGKVTFTWNASTDVQGGASGLTYNLWAGTAPGTATVMAPMSNLANGFRRVAQAGNVGQKRQWSLSRSAFPNGQIYWGVQAVDQAFAGSAFTTGPTATVDVGDAPLATRLALRLDGANPSRSETHLAYALPRDARVELAIHDITGRRLQTLVRGDRAAGEHQVLWRGEAADGSRSAPGLYFARLSTDGEAAAVRILRID